MNTELMNPVVTAVDHVFPVAIFDIAAPVSSRFKPDDEIEDEGAEIDDDDDEDDVGNPYDDENLPLEDEFDDEDFPSEDEDRESDEFYHLVEEGDEEADNILDGEVPPIGEQYELDDDEADEE